MANKLITPEEMAKYVAELMEKHGINKMLREATPEERDEIVLELMNTFGARMPRDLK